MPALRMTTLALMFVFAAASTARAQDTGEQADPAATEAVTATETVDDTQVVDETDALRTKVAALELMNRTLSDLRDKAQARVQRMTEYLQSTDKMSAYENADTTSDPGPQLTFDQAVETAVEHVKQNGVLDPSTLNVSSDQLQRDINGLETLVRPTFDQVVQLRAQSHEIAMFLHTNGDFDAYNKWAQDQTQQDAQAHAAEMAQRRQAANEQGEQEHEQAIQNLKQEEAQIQQQQQQQMQQAFQLKQQAMQDETQIQTAPYQNGNNPYWNDWNDNYNDIFWPHSGYQQVDVNVNHDRAGEAVNEPGRVVGPANQPGREGPGVDRGGRR